jgi:hypothetical protein
MRLTAKIVHTKIAAKQGNAEEQPDAGWSLYDGTVDFIFMFAVFNINQ